MSRVREARFIDLCLRGKAQPSEIDDFVELWHESESTLPLHDFLGMTAEEYAAWVQRPDLLSHIIRDHRNRRSA